MITRIVAKKELQAMLKALRSAGLSVEKLDAGYACEAPNGVLLLKAMQGNKGYLVRMRDDLFE